MSEPLPTERGESSDKSRAIALALAAPLGVLGVHRFYVGKIGTGVLMLLTGGGAAIWWILDLVSIASGRFRDRSGYPLSRWSLLPDPAERLTTPELLDELELLNEDLDDMSERLDEAERLLAERDAREEP